MDMDDDSNTPDTPVAAADTINSGQIMINMEAMIKNYISMIDKQQEEAKKLKEMLDDIFTNDETYQTHLKASNEASKKKNETKAQVLKRPQAADLDKKIKDIKAEMKENQGSLSDYLQEYQRMSGVNEIEGEDGQMREIVYTAKLIKKFTPQGY
jgi:septal ring factor EnvC (AmiA/AmiB activator)